MTELARVTSSQMRPDGVEVKDGAAWLRVTALSPFILRVQAGPGEDNAPENLYSVLPEQRRRRAAAEPLAGGGIGFTTEAFRVEIAADPLALSIQDAEGRKLAADALARPIRFRGQSFAVWQQLDEQTRIYGLGDKSGALDRRGRAFVNWNTDSYQWQESTDPLYKSIPFFLGLRDGAAWGVFLDNTWRSHFDFGVADRNALCFGAEGGALDYYVIAGPHPKQVIERYTALTGRIELPPIWALGFQQSRYSYESAARAREVVAAYRELGFPLDVLWLDIGFQDRNRPFTINAETFPDFAGLVEELDGQGVKVVAITDLHIPKLPDENYEPYLTGMAGDNFLRNPDGAPYEGKVWPGPSHFPDFSRAATRAWWGGLYRDFYLRDGVAGFWNDMNEPSVFEAPGGTMPLDVRHRVEEPDAPARETTHAELHNVYGLLNARATVEGLRELDPERRPFVLTRATFSGGQRDAAVWTGDNSSTLNHLRISTPQLINLGLSGFALCGEDIGGFTGDATPELLTQWTQLGAFRPLMRNHSELHTRDQELYIGDPVHVARRRRAVEARYRLLPYIYTAFEEAARTGTPVMRPMFLDYPRYQPPRGFEPYLFGRDLLVAPPPEQRLGPYPLPAPGWTEWFDYWTGLRAERKAIQPSPEHAPVFARAGSIIPHAPLTASTAEPPRGHLELRIYPGPDGAGALYADDGLTYAYKRGAWLRQSFSCRTIEGNLNLRIGAREGAFAPWWSGVDIVVFGQTAPPRLVRQGASEILFVHDADAASLRFTIATAVSAGEITVVA